MDALRQRLVEKILAQVDPASSLRPDPEGIDLGQKQGEMALEPIKASINETQCSGCRICNGLCPFNAISFHEDTMVSVINSALCQGCGTCVAACPAGAISGTGFSNEQIMAQIEGLMLLDVSPEPVAA